MQLTIRPFRKLSLYPLSYGIMNWLVNTKAQKASGRIGHMSPLLYQLSYAALNFILIITQGKSVFMSLSVVFFTNPQPFLNSMAIVKR